MDKIKHIQELVKLCNYHSNLYYTQDKPEISDKEYDKLFDKLTQLEQETGYILSNSPTQKVQGEILPFLKKVQHSEPMLSAEKSKDINDVLKFMGNQKCVLSWKLDGLTLVLIYNHGKLQQAITRGGGDQGEDVTHTVRTFTNVPLAIDYKGYLEIRGEGLVTFKEFERINEELISKGEEPYKTPRNLAAGSVRQLDSNITKSRNLIFIAFGIVKCDNHIFYKDLQFKFLRSQGFEVVYHEIVDKNTVEKWIEIFQSMIANLSFLTDGLIIEFNDIEYGKAQGSTGHHSKSLYALKWDDDSYETTFRGVELNTTRTGMVSITGLFDSIDIDGVNVSRATLHNYDIFQALELGIGDTITCYRANQVIPQIEDNLTRSGTLKINMKCPSCGEEIHIKQPKEARFLFCDNPKCPSKLVNKFAHFVSKNAMNIEGFSEATIEKFIDAGFLNAFADIYNLEQHKSEITKMDGMGKKSYEKLIQAINKSRTTELYRLIYALGIPQIGISSSKEMCKHFKNNIEAITRATYNQMIQVKDFGDVATRNVIKYFADLNNDCLVKEILKYVKIKQEAKKVESNSNIDLTGKTFVITGDFINFKPRKKLEELIESLGGKLTGSVSKSTFALLTNDTRSGSKKNQDAQKNNVQIIDENMFIKMLGE